MDASADLAEQLENLKRVHVILEVVQLLSANVLSISFDSLRDVVKSMIKYVNGPWRNHIWLDIHLPQFSNATMKVLESVKRFEPSEWGFKMGNNWFKMKKYEDHDETTRWKCEYGLVHNL
jgi:hypothetical protein